MSAMTKQKELEDWRGSMAGKCEGWATQCREKWFHPRSLTAENGESKWVQRETISSNKAEEDSTKELSWIPVDGGFSQN